MYLINDHPFNSLNTHFQAFFMTPLSLTHVFNKSSLRFSNTNFSWPMYLINHHPFLLQIPRNWISHKPTTFSSFFPPSRSSSFINYHRPRSPQTLGFHFHCSMLFNFFSPSHLCLFKPSSFLVARLIMKSHSFPCNPVDHEIKPISIKGKRGFHSGVLD